MILSLQALFLRFVASERERLVLWLPVLLAIGIGLFFALPDEPLAYAALLFPAIALAAQWFGRTHHGARIPTIALAVIACGFAAAQLHERVVAAPVLSGHLFYTPFEGTVEDVQDKAKGWGQRFILNGLQVEGLAPQQTPQKISLSIRRQAQDIQVGDRIRGKAMLFPPPTPVMPGAYDFARQFYFDRIGAVGFSPAPPELVSHQPPGYFEARLNALRVALNNRIIAPMTPENGPIAAAMMVGEMTAVSKDVGDAMRGAGIYHVFSISGLHMSLAAALVYVSIRFLLALYPPLAMRLPVKKIAACVGLLSSLAYLLLAGYPVPAIRSFVMVACVMLAIVCDRRGISLYSLAWSAFVILLFQPEALLGASFQLSYAATIAIVAFYERYGHLLHAGDAGIFRRIRTYFWGLILTSLVATLATTPLVIYHFNRFTLWGIIANMLMIPLASFWLMPAAVLAFIAMPLGLEYWPLVWLDKGNSLMMSGARGVAAMPYASISIPPPSFPGLLFVVFGGLWLCLWKGRWRLWGVPLVVFGSLSIFLYEPYDILISEDASKVAMRLNGQDMVFVKGRPGSFDGQAWVRAGGQKEGLKIDDMEDDDEKLPNCDRTRCDIRFAGLNIVVARKKKERDGLCADVDGHAPDMVIGVDYMDRIPECRRVRWLIEKAFLRENGAVAIRIRNGQAIIETANEYRGNRPWSRMLHSSLYQSANPSMIPGKSP